MHKNHPLDVRTSPNTRKGKGKYVKIIENINKYFMAFSNTFPCPRNMLQLKDRTIKTEC